MSLTVIPAKAGIHAGGESRVILGMDASLRWHDGRIAHV